MNPALAMACFPCFSNSRFSFKEHSEEGIPTLWQSVKQWFRGFQFMSLEVLTIAAHLEAAQYILIYSLSSLKYFPFYPDFYYSSLLNTTNKLEEYNR